MKKIINNQEQVVEEMLDGFMAAYGDEYRKIDGVNGVVRKNKKEKVGIVIGGGSGHEPLFLGYVGEGLADGVAVGNVFAAPTPNNVHEVTKAVDSGKGVLHIIINYAGDVMNFEMGAELAEMEGLTVKTVSVCDDVVSAPIERSEERRGIAGALYVYKIAGAAAEQGLSLEEVARIAQKASDSIRTVGIALTPGTIPNTGLPTFELADDEMEFGMGIHGEPGVHRTKLLKADELTDKMLTYIFNEMPLENNEEVCVLVNGLGSTTPMELMIVNRRIAQILEERNIRVYNTDIGNFCTTQEMGGMSISLLKLDDELKKYFDVPAYSPFYMRKGK
ncbi:dihydroxyacetone kinase subunit DhaK [Alkalihalobacillus sp. MEB130]|uniref:dihydroxyacetone kinase subunit DhaK n=1 Tax=Alkalihalobacillus sp. MEB130 TaxID=2976704 RepID=UPI0028DFD0C8|nr:dihydroxyacetone kinase subunit DhaK [Alkalihalobacillus sp. MEB130]MDT8862974.1 dihydroxyacetone kinase subunit DhaK [Alkalihalobacillus sp. MEB130]